MDGEIQWIGVREVGAAAFNCALYIMVATCSQLTNHCDSMISLIPTIVFDLVVVLMIDDDDEKTVEIKITTTSTIY